MDGRDTTAFLASQRLGGPTIGPKLDPEGIPSQGQKCHQSSERVQGLDDWGQSSYTGVRSEHTIGVGWWSGVDSGNRDEVNYGYRVERKLSLEQFRPEPSGRMCPALGAGFFIALA